jgi:hypothetical protein
MSLVISEQIVATIAGHFSKLSNKKVLLVDHTFDFKNVQKSVLELFPETLASVDQSSAVLASFKMPKIEIIGARAEATGPIEVDQYTKGTITGFLIFDGDFDQKIVSTDATIFEKLLLASDSVGAAGKNSILELNETTVSFTEEILFYGLVISIAGDLS